MPRFKADKHPKHAMEHRAKQLNSNNEAYWKSRGEERRPQDWQRRSTEDRRDDT